jgi:MbtH protein
MAFDREDATFKVLVNDEEQYSLWPDYKAVPAGWREAGKSGQKQECLDYIETVWTDMRPLSLRRHMEGQGGR